MFELIPFDRRMHRLSNYDPFREMDEFFNMSFSTAPRVPSTPLFIPT